MAKVIEFYTPKNFRRSVKWNSGNEHGKVIECTPQVKTQPRPGVMMITLLGAPGMVISLGIRTGVGELRRPVVRQARISGHSRQAECLAVEIECL
jgi:hypothetical protein